MKKQFVIEAAQVLFDDEEIDLKVLPPSKRKQEFLDLVEKHMKSQLNSLEKARLEFLIKGMKILFEKYKNRDEIEKEKEKAIKKKQQRNVERKLLQKRTKNGNQFYGI
jgi:hypothetical protein